MCETTRVVTMTPHSHISTPRGPRTSNRSFGTNLSSWDLGKVDIWSLKCLSIKDCHLHLCYLLLRHLCMITTASSIFPDYVCLRWVRWYTATVVLFPAFSLIMFAYSGSASFPTYQADMQNKSDFPKAVLLAMISMGLELWRTQS